MLLEKRLNSFLRCGIPHHGPLHRLGRHQVRAANGRSPGYRVMPQGRAQPHPLRYAQGVKVRAAAWPSVPWAAFAKSAIGPGPAAEASCRGVNCPPTPLAARAALLTWVKAE